MKIIAFAAALAFAGPALAQSQDVHSAHAQQQGPMDPSRHNPAEHAEHMRHQQGGGSTQDQHQGHGAGCCQKGEEGRMACCKKDGAQSDCCDKMQQPSKAPTAPQAR